MSKMDLVLAAIEHLEANNIKYELRNMGNGHFHCWTYKSEELVQFWATTGTILGHKERGIDSLILILLNN